MDIEGLMSRVKASREAKGLKSTYTVDGRTFEMFHPTEAHKAFYDFKYQLKALYLTEADVPPTELEKFYQLHAEMRK